MRIGRDIKDSFGVKKLSDQNLILRLGAGSIMQLITVNFVAQERSFPQRVTVEDARERFRP
jgi:hypothetical protein